MNEWEEEIEYVNSKWCFWTWKAKEPQFSRFLFLVRHGKWHHANKNTPTRTLAGYTGNVIAFRWSFLGRGPSWHYKLACNNSLVQCAATSPISVQHASWHFFSSLLPIVMSSAHSLFTCIILSLYIFSWTTSWTQSAEVRSTRSTFAASDWMKGSLAQLAIRPRIAICSASKSPADHVGCCSGGKVIMRRRRETFRTRQVFRFSFIQLMLLEIKASM